MVGRALLLILAWAMSPSASATHASQAANPKAESDLLIQSWNPGSDVRERSVRSMLQSRDGYLWLATEHGLIRFDGVTFTNFALQGSPGISASLMSFYTLWEDPRGVIWAGTDGKGVIQYDHGHFRTLTTSSGLSGDTIQRIDGDAAGATWIFTSTGVSRYQDGKLSTMHPELERGPGVSSFRFDSSRTPDHVHMGLWRTGPDGVELFSFGHWRPFPLPQGKAETFYADVESIYEDALQRIWFSLRSEPGRYYCRANGKLISYEHIPLNSFISYQDREGYLWLTDHAGHAARWKDGIRYSLAPFASPYLLNVIERSDGSFWLGTQHVPLYLLRPRLIKTLPTLGVPEIGALLFQQRSGAVWAAGTGFQKLVGDQLQPLKLPESLSGLPFFNTLGEDPQGHLLFNIRDSFNLLELRGRRYVPYPDTSTLGAVHHVYLDRLGQQWFATDAGLWMLAAHGFRTHPKMILRAEVTCMLETAPGQLWVGTPSGPLLISGDHIEALPGTDHWSYGAVNAMDTDFSGSIWIGTKNAGLVLYRNQSFHAFGSADGLPMDTVATVQAGDPAAIWLKTDVGLLRIGRQSLERRLHDADSDLQIRRFDDTDGLPSTAMFPYGNEGSLRLADGTLWFSTNAGIASVDPAKVPLSETVPHTLLAEHVIDQGRLESSDPIVMEPGQDDLEMHYTGLGSEAPAALKFRYRLYGVDDDWVRAGTRRSAYYSHLAPGSYRFQVQAANGNGQVWDVPGATTVVRVLAPWYKQRWLHVLAVLVLVALLLVALWRREQRIKESARQRQAFTRSLISSQESERKRIAHDLHDSLGQHLALILAYLRPRRSDPAKVQELLTQIEEQAHAAIDEVQAISNNLRPHQLDRLGLTNAVHSLVQHLEDASMLEITSEIADIDGAFPKDLQINFYRIVQESLGNVLRHSQATRVAVRIDAEPLRVLLSISDNGKGFSPSPPHGRRGMGLSGISERAEVLGGHARIESKEGAGTQVVVEIPLTAMIDAPQMGRE